MQKCVVLHALKAPPTPGGLESSIETVMWEIPPQLISEQLYQVVARSRAGLVANTLNMLWTSAGLSVEGNQTLRCCSALMAAVDLDVQNSVSLKLSNVWFDLHSGNILTQDG